MIVQGNKMSKLTFFIVLAGLLFFPGPLPAGERDEPTAALCARRDLQALREAQEEMTVRDIAAATGIKESTLRQLLKGLAKEGRCGGAGKYRAHLRRRTKGRGRQRRFPFFRTGKDSMREVPFLVGHIFRGRICPARSPSIRASLSRKRQRDDFRHLLSVCPMGCSCRTLALYETTCLGALHHDPQPLYQCQGLDLQRQRNDFLPVLGARRRALSRLD